MEMNWVVSGAFANWSMTVTITPPDDLDCEDCVSCSEGWRTEPFNRVYAYFADIVNLMEAGRQLDDTRRAGPRLA